MKDTNPVLIGGLTAGGLISLFEAILGLGRAMGWWSLNDEQAQAWLVVIRIGLPIVVTVLASFWVNSKTTPLAQPRDEEGVRLVRETDNRPTKAETEYRSIDRRKS